MNFAFLGYLLVGKLLVWVIQIFPLTKSIKRKFFRELIQCDFCLGCWVFFGLAFVFPGLEFFTDIVVIREFLFGIVSAFITHIFFLGLKSKFEIIVFEE